MDNTIVAAPPVTPSATPKAYQMKGSLLKLPKLALLYAVTTNIKRQHPERFRGVSSGLADIDDRYGGIQRGGYDLLVGKPKAGKTAALMTMFIRRILSGDRGLYCTREMTNLQMMVRFFAFLSGVSLTKLRDFDISEEDMSEIWRVVDLSSGLEAYFYHGDGNLLLCKQIIDEIKPNFVTFDYAQLFWIPGVKKGYDNLTAVSEFFRMLTMPIQELEKLTMDEIRALTVDDIIELEKDLPALQTAVQVDKRGKQRKKIDETDTSGTSAFLNDCDRMLVMNHVYDVDKLEVPNRRRITIPPGRWTEGGEFDTYFDGAHSKIVCLAEDSIPTVDLDEDPLFRYNEDNT